MSERAARAELETLDAIAERQKHAATEERGAPARLLASGIPVGAIMPVQLLALQRAAGNAATLELLTNVEDDKRPQPAPLPTPTPADGATAVASTVGATAAAPATAATPATPAAPPQPAPHPTPTPADAASTEASTAGAGVAAPTAAPPPAAAATIASPAAPTAAAKPAPHPTPVSTPIPLAPPKVPTRAPMSGGLPAGGDLEAVAGPAPAGAVAATTEAGATAAAPGAQPSGGYGIKDTVGGFLKTVGGGDALTGTRAMLELTRPIPLWGMFPGMAADTIALYQDLDALPKDSPFAVAVTVFRDGTALINNVLGAVAAIDQDVQTVATATVAGAAITPVTASVNEVTKTAKMWANGIQLFLDLLIATESGYQASKSPMGSEQLNKWNTVFQGYEATILTDLIGTIIDAIDLTTGGFANGDNVKGLARWTFHALKTIRPMGRTIVTVINNVVGLYTNKGMPKFTGTAPAPPQAAVPARAAAPAAAAPVQRAAASTASGLAGELAIDALITEIVEAKADWKLADGVIGEVENQARKLEIQMRQMATVANHGRDPFIVMRDQASKALSRANAAISELTHMGLAAGTIVTDSTNIIAMTDAALASVDRLRVPAIHVPMPKEDGLVAGLERKGAEAAEMLLQSLLTPLRIQADALRAEASAPLLSAKKHAVEISDFSRIFQVQCVRAVELMNHHVAVLSQKLGHVQNFEQLVDMLMRQITEALGIAGGAGLDDVRVAWAGIGTTLDEAEAWAVSARQQMLASNEVEDETGAAIDTTLATQPPDAD